MGAVPVNKAQMFWQDLGLKSFKQTLQSLWCPPAKHQFQIPSSPRDITACQIRQLAQGDPINSA